MKNNIIWFAITYHLIWAGLLVQSSEPTSVTGLNMLYRVFPNRFLLAGVLAASAILAILAITKARRFVSLFLMLPQQFMLLVPLLAVVTAISTGTFADGVVRSSVFLAADKIGIVLLAVFHSLMLLQPHKLDIDTGASYDNQKPNQTIHRQET